MSIQLGSIALENSHFAQRSKVGGPRIMSNFSGKATAPQIEVAAQIERETTRLKDLAVKTDLRFLVYLIEMAHDEAAVIAKGKKDKSEDVGYTSP